MISVNDEITISASSKIALIAGQSSVTLEGSDIEFKTPGAFAAKGGGHAFLGGGIGAMQQNKLPDSRVKLFDQQIRALNELTGEPIAGMPYKLTTSDGDTYYGRTDEHGKTLRVGTVAQAIVSVEWGSLPPATKG